MMLIAYLSSKIPNFRHIFRHNMASGRNAFGDEINKFHFAIDAVNGVDEINVGKRLADHRTLRLHWFLFDVNMDFRISHV